MNPFGPIQIVQVLLGIISLVCYILVLVKMFQNGQTGLGVACIVLLFCAGIGALIAFIVGWINAARWGITNIMILWTGCLLVDIVLGIIAITMAGGVGAPVLPPAR